MAQPLFVHPQLGAAVMRSYLDTPMDNAAKPQSRHGDNDEYSYAVTIRDNVAVMDVSGALTAREENVPCAQSPASYEVIKQDMQALMANKHIDTIIGRFDSPGGMAAQNMDLSDYIYASRGQGKKLIAMVDDMAYSAAYGIASAFDQIWVTRTSGVGSVGVVSYHVDQSEADAKAGIKIEYIFAGDKKVLGNPHEALTEEGRASYQQEVSRLYTLFTSTIARNLGMTLEAVQATQAGTFHGEEAVNAGFAHVIGTFDQLLESLTDERELASQVAAAAAIRQEADAPVIEAVVEEPVIEATIAIEVAVEDEPILAEVEEPVIEATVEEPTIEATEDEPVIEAAVEDEPVIADKSVELAAQDALAAQAKYEAGVRGLCLAAGVPDAASDFILADMSIVDIRANLLDLTSTPQSSIVSATSIALKRDRSDVQAGWRKAIRKAQGTR